MKTFQILLEQVVNLQEEAYRKNTRRIDSLKNKLRKGIVKQVKGGKDEVVVKGFSLDSIFHAFNLYHDAGRMVPTDHPLHSSEHPLHGVFRSLLNASKGKIQRDEKLFDEDDISPVRSDREKVRKNPLTKALSFIRRDEQQIAKYTGKALKKGVPSGSPEMDRFVDVALNKRN